MVEHSNPQAASCTDDAEVIKRHVVRWLLDGGLKFRGSEDAIGNEVLFSCNWRRADLLILSKEFHALEIKSDADSLSRLADQLGDYHRVFERVSVVTTSKQVQGVRQSTATKTGIILFDGVQPEVVRQARLATRLDKLELTRFLDKAELVDILGRNWREMSTDELRHRVAHKYSINEIRRVAYAALRRRYRKLFQLFLRDVGDSQFGEDELRGLCGHVRAITL
ncbi:MAG TPA: sce7726 family protein [Thermoguttaceae bacterium]|nr:sce7726 family protein [Thermoguttaceae bacterium]